MIETFWTIIPFITPFLIIFLLYKKYKNSEKEEVQKASWLSQQSFFKYVGLVFFIRPNLRPWTSIWYFPLLFGFLGCFTIGDVITSTIYPPLPLEKMHTQEGVIKSISKRKKMDDLLVLEINNNKNREFAVFRDYGLLLGLNKKVKVWYSRGFSSIYTIDDIIYEVTINGKSIKKHPYDYKRYLEGDASSWNFTKYSFYSVVFSLLMIWIPNRNELPIHRLNRMRLYKKNKEV